MTARRQASRSRSAGFTLVELGAVVAIIGILAVLGVVAYRKYILHAKITEAQNIVAAIKIAQEDNRAERGTYADLGPAYCPAIGGVSDRKVGWDPECAGGGSHPDPKWKQLPVHVNGAVQFKYATVAGTGAYVPPADAAWVTINAGAGPVGPWFVVLARCDLDGVAGSDTQLFGASFTNQIFTNNDGN